MKRFACIISLLCLPAITWGAVNNLDGLMDLILFWIKLLTQIVFGFALLVFFWGLALFMLEAGSTDGNKKGKNLMIWGVIVFFVMASLWGIIAYLQSSFDINPNQRPIDQPQIDPGSIDTRPSGSNLPGEWF